MSSNFWPRTHQDSYNSFEGDEKVTTKGLLRRKNRY